eukprot:6468457-Amphidinium_carterae.1
MCSLWSVLAETNDNTKYPCGGYGTERIGLARRTSCMERGLHPQPKCTWQLLPASQLEWLEWSLPDSSEKLPGVDADEV